MMSILFLLTTLLLCNAEPVIPTEKQQSEIPVSLWKCGDNADLLSATCPEYAVELNHCCVVHNDCSQKPKPAGECESRLCNCMHKVAMEKPSCRQFADLKCGQALSKTFPISNMSLPIKDQRVPEIPKIAMDYKALYQKCSSQNSTFASCALVYDSSIGNLTEKVLGLFRCLDDSKMNRNSDRVCDEALDVVLNKLISADDVIDVNVYIANATLRVANILRKVYRRSATPGSILFIGLILAGFVVLICCVSLFAIHMRHPVVFDDIGPNTDANTEKSNMETYTSSER